MMKFKKIIALMLVLVSVLSLASCGGIGGTEKTTASEIELAPTAQENAVSDPDRGENKVKMSVISAVGGFPLLRLELDRGYGYTIVERGADSMKSAQLLKEKKADIASVRVEALPAIAAQTDIVVVAGLNNLVVSAVVKSDSEAESIKDFSGKTVYCGGKDSIAQYATEKAFADAGVRAELVFMADDEVSQKIKSGEAEYFVLREPQAIYAVAENEDYKRVFEVVKADDGMADSCLVARADFVAQNPEILKETVLHVEGCTNSLCTEGGMLYTATEFVKAGYFSSNETASQAITHSGIKFTEKDEMKEAVNGTLEFAGRYNSELKPLDDGAFLLNN